MLSNLFTRFGWSRDDLKWTLAMIAAVIVGVAALGNAATDYGIPASWLPYVRLGALIVGILSGKMATSNLFGAGNVPGTVTGTGDGVKPSTLDKIAKSAPALLLVAGLGLGLAACAHPRHTAVVIDTALFETMSDVHAGEQQALCGLPSCAGSPITEFVKGWTLAKSQSFNRKLLPAVESGRQFNRVLASWDPSRPAPAELHQLIPSISASIAAVLADMPDGTTKTAVLANLNRAQGLVLNAIDLVLGGTR